MRKLVPLKSIYAFVAVAEMGSMTEAADVLCVSHSAISQAIKALEKQIGQPLFNRTGRRVELNQAGRKYYRKVAPALEQIVEATEELVDIHHDKHLTINMVHSLALHWWIPRVPDFQQAMPELDVRISNILGSFELEREGVDIALIHGKPNEWEDYYCEKLGDDELIMVCSPQLIELATSPPLKKALKSPHLIDSAKRLLSHFPPIFVTNDRRKHDWQVWCEANGIELPLQQNNLTFSASIQAVQATIRRLGVLITHRQFVRDDITHGVLAEIGPSVLNPYQDYYFVCPPDKLRRETALMLRAWLREQFK
ncbi:LysR family transcriptional regulator [Photobacterium swingsii]|uniref:LysR family transcriptional regulator n=1 Tax=Photobacterium swingsii TaxID=680026 RepID=A0A0J8XSX5_9GAMM|nr:LysR substrate-binding domain-containing protein [Photobacterium swingsii]KMV28479.1 LysR family transcriptional regulator [Photobacterium swingsii]PSW22774.1 LysR family transcriptional regulator [Photobacterium swingsii]